MSIDNEGDSWVPRSDEPTRPQPSAEPVAWMYRMGETVVFLQERLHTEGILRGETGWTETPLYPANALEAARREALEQAANFVENRKCSIHFSGAERHAAYEHAVRLAENLRALKENPNAG